MAHNAQATPEPDREALLAAFCEAESGWLK
jgi:hypothetical protein